MLISSVRYNSVIPPRLTYVIQLMPMCMVITCTEWMGHDACACCQQFQGVKWHKRHPKVLPAIVTGLGSAMVQKIHGAILATWSVPGTNSYFVHLCVHCSARVCWICLVSLTLLQHGRTALYYASGKGNIEVIKFLLENGARINEVQHCNVL